MFVQNFTKLSDLSCWQRKKLTDNAENNTALTTAGSNYLYSLTYNQWLTAAEWALSTEESV